MLPGESDILSESTDMLQGDNDIPIVRRHRAVAGRQ
jgi:hypothetical protein